jgi:hypothetical protein
MLSGTARQERSIFPDRKLFLTAIPNGPRLTSQLWVLSVRPMGIALKNYKPTGFGILFLSPKPSGNKLTGVNFLIPDSSTDRNSGTIHYCLPHKQHFYCANIFNTLYIILAHSLAIIESNALTHVKSKWQTTFHTASQSSNFTDV